MFKEDKLAPPRQGFYRSRHAADLIGLPWNWLCREAKAGRIPHLRAGKSGSLYFNIKSLEECLIKRSWEACVAQPDHPSIERRNANDD